MWRTCSSLGYIAKAFDSYAVGWNITGSDGPSNDVYANSPDNGIYFNEFKLEYEILNPTNYDMNLVIYDIVCRCDTTLDVGSTQWPKTAIANQPGSNPIRLISDGCKATEGYYPDHPSYNGNMLTSEMVRTTLTADSTRQDLSDVSLKPSNVYYFNLYWKIKRKHFYRLQPGATLKHTFIHKPKALMTRGFFGYKYVNNLAKKDDIETPTINNIGIKDVTSGCLFKYWGQIAGSGEQGFTDTTDYLVPTPARYQVAQLSGKIAIKEYG